MLDKNSILDEAIHKCYKEMYAKAQPSVDYDQLLQDYKEGKIEKDACVYERYYLSHEEFKYILNKYIESYRLESKWIHYIEILEDYLQKGGTKDKYIPSHTDENGNYHPGHRGYEQVASIKNQIKNILNEYLEIGNRSEILCDKITSTIMDTIKNCKDFYKFDRDAQTFSATIALGCSPTSNPITVKEYWKSQGVDIEIEERNPLLFWEKDYYGDEFEEVMEDEYGLNWKDIWDKKWKEEKNAIHE